MARRDMLREYFRQVVQDLVASGEVRRRRGQSIDAILSAELPRVLQEIQVDFSAILMEMGASIVGAVPGIIENLARDKLTQVIGGWLRGRR